MDNQAKITSICSIFSFQCLFLHEVCFILYNASFNFSVLQLIGFKFIYCVFSGIKFSSLVNKSSKYSSQPFFLLGPSISFPNSTQVKNLVCCAILQIQIVKFSTLFVTFLYHFILILVTTSSWSISAPLRVLTLSTDLLHLLFKHIWSVSFLVVRGVPCIFVHILVFEDSPANKKAVMVAQLNQSFSSFVHCPMSSHYLIFIIASELAVEITLNQEYSVFFTFSNCLM